MHEEGRVVKRWVHEFPFRFSVQVRNVLHRMYRMCGGEFRGEPSKETRKPGRETRNVPFVLSSFSWFPGFLSVLSSVPRRAREVLHNSCRTILCSGPKPVLQLSSRRSRVRYNALSYVLSTRNTLSVPMGAPGDSQPLTGQLGNDRVHFGKISYKTRRSATGSYH